VNTQDTQNTTFGRNLHDISIAKNRNKIGVVNFISKTTLVFVVDIIYDQLTTQLYCKNTQEFWIKCLAQLSWWCFSLKLKSLSIF